MDMIIGRGGSLLSGRDCLLIYAVIPHYLVPSMGIWGNIWCHKSRSGIESQGTTH
ncbi:hypothetical protein CPB86DRAFT_626601 [Serendipita vermifera]|nr:hypothetical protein CPB86DRAFT_626601 [Serendipita vermifera]